MANNPTRVEVSEGVYAYQLRTFAKRFAAAKAKHQAAASAAPPKAAATAK